MPKWLTLTFCCFILAVSTAAWADDLTRMAQQELSALGYDIDNTEGELTTKTIVAISKFQAENNMEVTGEATPQLIGALRAAGNAGGTLPAAEAAPAPAVAATTMTPEQQAADLQARQQACLQEKYAAAQERNKTSIVVELVPGVVLSRLDLAHERNKKKRGMMRLLSAVSRTSRQFGDSSLANDISRASYEAYSANATASDLEAAGKDLGLTPDEMEQCRNPQ